MSVAVLSWARLLAESYRAQVEIFHAEWAPKIELAEERGQEGLSFGAIATEIEGHINSLAESILGKRISYTIHLREGHPVKAVVEYIVEHRPDVVVLGSHGYDGFARVLLGSVTENVLRMAASPILVVKGAPLPSQLQSLRAIVCAVDFSDISRCGVLIAGDLASLFGADLYIVYVAPQGVSFEQARCALARWIPDPVWACSTAHDVVLRGDAAEKIVTYARQMQSDLTMVAAEHRPFLEFTTLGRTTERVVRYCPSSVLVIPKVHGKPEFAVVEPGTA